MSCGIYLPLVRDFKVPLFLTLVHAYGLFDISLLKLNAIKDVFLRIAQNFQSNFFQEYLWVNVSINTAKITKYSMKVFCQSVAS